MSIQNHRDAHTKSRDFVSYNNFKKNVILMAGLFMCNTFFKS